MKELVVAPLLHNYFRGKVPPPFPACLSIFRRHFQEELSQFQDIGD